MKKTVTLFGALIVVLGLTACNTIKGMGQDVERGGEKVQGAASKQQQK
jgi:entericidin B